MAGKNAVNTGTTSSLDKKTYNFEWRIENYDIVKDDNELLCQQVLNVVTGESSDFPMEWKFDLYIDINRSRRPFHHDYIGLRMTLLNPEEAVQDKIVVRADLNIPNVDGSKSGFPICASRMRATLPILVSGCKWKNLFRMDTHVNELPLVNGCLKINIELEVFLEKTSNSSPTIVVNSNEKGTDAADFTTFQKGANDKFVEDMKTLLETEQMFHDLKIISATGKEYSVSKMIFTARSPVFAAMFNSQMKENRTGILEMKDMSDEMLELLVNYLQFGKLSQDMFTESESIIDVAYAAEKYELPQLQSFCDEMLSKKFDKLNIRGTLEIAEKLRLKKTVGKISNYIKYTIR